MIHHLHKDVRSTRLHDVTHEMAIDWLSQLPNGTCAALNLQARQARLVAAFQRRATNGEKWNVYIFTAVDGSEICYATDMRDCVGPERSDAYGDSIGLNY